MAVANAASEQSYEIAASDDDPVCLWVSSQPTEQLFTIKRRTYQICRSADRNSRIRGS
jgi:hypothetical protein